jgi:hypothetical protein
MLILPAIARCPCGRCILTRHVTGQRRLVAVVTVSGVWDVGHDSFPVRLTEKQRA